MFATALDQFVRDTELAAPGAAVAATKEAPRDLSAVLPALLAIYPGPLSAEKTPTRPYTTPSALPNPAQPCPAPLCVPSMNQ